MAAPGTDVSAVDNNKAAEIVAKISGMWVKTRSSEEIKVDLTPIVDGVRDGAQFNFYIRLVRCNQHTRFYKVRRYHLPNGFQPSFLRQHGELGVHEDNVDDFLHELRRVCHCSASRLLQFNQLMEENPRLPFLRKSVRVLGLNSVSFKMACVDGVTPVVVTFSLGYHWASVRPYKLNLDCDLARPEFLESLRKAKLNVFQSLPLRVAIEDIAGCYNTQ